MQWLYSENTNSIRQAHLRPVQPWRSRCRTCLDSAFEVSLTTRSVLLAGRLLNLAPCSVFSLGHTSSLAQLSSGSWGSQCPAETIIGQLNPQHLPNCHSRIFIFIFISFLSFLHYNFLARLRPFRLPLTTITTHIPSRRGGVY